MAGGPLGRATTAPLPANGDTRHRASASLQHLCSRPCRRVLTPWRCPRMIGSSISIKPPWSVGGPTSGGTFASSSAPLLAVQWTSHSRSATRP